VLRLRRGGREGPVDPGEQPGDVDPLGALLPGLVAGVDAVEDAAELPGVESLVVGEV
jgi:hypothetical protein